MNFYGDSNMISVPAKRVIIMHKKYELLFTGGEIAACKIEGKIYLIAEKLDRTVADWVGISSSELRRVDSKYATFVDEFDIDLKIVPVVNF